MQRVAVLLPCHNEALTIARVIHGFRDALPDAQIYVYDNASTDGTAREARAAGAIVREEPLLGKGNVVRRMLADVDAAVYVMADGDGTYPPELAPKMIERLVAGHLDMVVGKRIAVSASDAFRFGHVRGNQMMSTIVASLFGRRFTDVFSGYRVLSRRFVKSFPATSTGFEIETELSIHALQLSLPVAETPTPYYARPTGSSSKLSTWRDGARIARVILHLYKEEQPLKFFGILSAGLSLLSVALFVPIFRTYLETGLVPRFPTAILSASIMLAAIIAMVCGVVLDSVSRGRRESKRLHYMSFRPAAADYETTGELHVVPQKASA